MPHTGQPMCGLRQIAWRSARQVLSADGAPRENHIASDRPGVVVQHCRQPRTGGLSALVEDQKVEQGVVRLPNGIGQCGAVSMDQLIAIAEGGGSLLRQGHHGRVESGEDSVDGAVRRNAPALRLSDAASPAMDRGYGSGRLLQAHTLDERHKVGRVTTSAGIATRRPPQPRQPILSIPVQPSLRRAERHACVGGRARERGPVLEVRPKHREAGHRQPPLFFT